MAKPSYHCPACGRDIAADRPRWRCDCGGPLDLAPGPGLSRREIEAGNASLWRYARRWLSGTRRGLARRGLDAAGERDWDGASDPLQARIPDADRLVQGPRHRGHVQPSARGRGRPDPRGFLGQCRLVDRDLCRRGGTRLPHLRPGERRRAARSCRSPRPAPRSRRSPAPARR